MAPLCALRCAYPEGRLYALLYDGVFQPLYGKYEHILFANNILSVIKFEHGTFKNNVNDRQTTKSKINTLPASLTFLAWPMEQK
jgi:hypothetical protein